MRSTIRRLALVPGTLLAAGALVLGMASAAGAQVHTTNWAGYRAGNGNWHFRYAQGTFVIPQHACTGDDFTGTAVHLGGSIDYATVGVFCTSAGALESYLTYNSQPAHGTQYGNAGVATADDTVFASLYYNTANNTVNAYEYDETAGVTLVNTFVPAGNAQYKWATVAGLINPAQPFPPGAGTSITLVPWTQARATAVNGTAGKGLNGPWGVQDEEVFNGAHEIAGGTGANGTISSFNTTEFGNP